MKRRSIKTERTGTSPYNKRKKVPYKYPFPTGKAYVESKQRKAA